MIEVTVSALPGAPVKVYTYADPKAFGIMGEDFFSVYYELDGEHRRDRIRTRDIIYIADNVEISKTVRAVPMPSRITT